MSSGRRRRRAGGQHSNFPLSSMCRIRRDVCVLLAFAVLAIAASAQARNIKRQDGNERGDDSLSGEGEMSMPEPVPVDVAKENIAMEMPQPKKLTDEQRKVKAVMKAGMPSLFRDSAPWGDSLAEQQGLQLTTPTTDAPLLEKPEDGEEASLNEVDKNSKERRPKPKFSSLADTDVSSNSLADDPTPANTTTAANQTVAVSPTEGVSASTPVNTTVVASPDSVQPTLPTNTTPAPTEQVQPAPTPTNSTTTPTNATVAPTNTTTNTTTPLLNMQAPVGGLNTTSPVVNITPAQPTNNTPATNQTTQQPTNTTTQPTNTTTQPTNTTAPQNATQGAAPVRNTTTQQNTTTPNPSNSPPRSPGMMPPNPFFGPNRGGIPGAFGQGDLQAARNAQQSQNTSQKPTSNCPNMDTRVPWSQASSGQRQAYLNAIRCMATIPGKWDGSRDGNPSHSMYEDWVLWHNYMQPLIHRNAALLPCHRLFMNVWFAQMRSQCGYQGQLLYMDWWTYGDRNQIWTSPDIWGQYYGNADGLVRQGAFAGIRVNYSASYYSSRNVQRVSRPICRQYRTISSNGIPYVSYMTSNFVRSLLRESNYDSFRRQLEETFHQYLHVSIGCDLVPTSSPNCPTFFAIHSAVDYVWAVWQEINGGANRFKYNGPHGEMDFSQASPTDTCTMLGMWSVDFNVQDLLDINSKPNCYTYQWSPSLSPH